jgi:hypothetical protein
MRIDGQWLVGDDGVVRPVISGDIRTADGSWEQCEFLVDTGADRTVFNAATLAKRGLQPLAMSEGLSGVGGMAASVIVERSYWIAGAWHGRMVYTDGISSRAAAQESNRAGPPQASQR